MKKNLKSDIISGASFQLLAGTGHSGSFKSVDKLEDEHSGYLEALFCRTLTMKGSDAKFAELALQMNLLSTSLLETHPVTHLSRKLANRLVTTVASLSMDNFA